MAVKTEESGPIALKKYMSFLDEGVCVCVCVCVCMCLRNADNIDELTCDRADEGAAARV